MRELTLPDAEVQRALGLFLTQARICAKTPHAGKGSILGVAAMCTVFPCLLAVGEALAREQKDYGNNPVPNRDVVEAFLARMNDRAWLISPDGVVCSDTAICRVLGNIRHGLAHAVSMPKDTSLISRKSAAQKSPLSNWKIIVPDFVKAVEETIAQIGQELPGLDLSEVIKDRELVYAHPLGPKSLLSGHMDTATSSGD